MTQHIGLGDGAIDVRNDHFVAVLPAEHVAFASGCALVGRCHTEHHLVDAFLQVKALLQTEKNNRNIRLGSIQWGALIDIQFARMSIAMSSDIYHMIRPHSSPMLW